MKKIIIINLVILITITNTKAQSLFEPICGTEDKDSTVFYNQPWIGNNSFLENFLDSIGYPKANTSFRIIGNDRVKLRIPIKFWVYRRSNATGGPNLIQLKQLINS